MLAGLEPPMRARLLNLLEADRDPHDPLPAMIGGALHHNEGLPGQRVGAWRILREIGAGGMGTVLLAERADGQYAQQAAIKLIRGFATEDGRRRLRMERQILAELDHPNIARLLDGGETADGQPYVAMEYVDGVELLDYIASHRLTLLQRLDLFDRIADAVQHAHQRLVIHRDLKPDNVLVRSDGEPKLLDFGVAKLIDVSVDNAARHTSTRVWTPGYASPEQKQGKAVTTTTDVYSLGVMLSEMLTGTRAAAGSEIARAPAESTHAPTASIKPVAISLDAELRGILAMASAEQPTQRYPSVEALREDLRRYREGRPLRAARDSGWYRMRKFLRRHRTAVAAVTMAIAVIALFVGQLAAERQRALAAEAQALARGKAAERSAATARHTLDYVIDIFNAANPENTQGRTITPRMLVDEAAAQLTSRLDDDPEAKLGIQIVLAQFYNALGESAQAIALLEPVLADAPVATREDALQLADAVDQLAFSLGMLSQNDRASAAKLRSAELRETWAADDPIEMFNASLLRADAAYTAGDLGTARAGFEAALMKARAAPAIAPESVDETLMMLSDTYALEGDFPAADRMSSELLKRIELRYPELHWLRIRAVKLRAMLLTKLGRYDEAEMLLRRAIKNQEQLIGPNGTTLATLINELGVTLGTAGRFREASEQLSRSLALLLKASGPGADADPAVLLNLGSVQEGAGDYVASLATMQRAIELQRRRNAPESTGLIKANANYARTLALAGRIDEARRLMQSVVATYKAAGKGSEFEWAFETFRLAQIEFLAGQLGDATRLVDDAQPTLVQALPAGHPALANVLRLRGRIALAGGDLELADRELNASRLMQVAAKALPLDLALIDVSRAGVAAARGDNDQARAILAPALDLLRDQVLPTERTRAEGERLALRLNLRPPKP
jgi:tetratricopeptide (TPR) repeat protein/tRNA A-37 threonylcarbamoyl transferase component Bud32